MASLYSQGFIRAVNFLLDPTVEGAGTLSLDPKDDGNWTGGAVGQGKLVGTKWGISAAAYPALDVAALSRESAVAIYYRDYWIKIRGDELPPRLGICALDSAVNQGQETAIKLLQAALGLQTDGVFGPATLSGVRTMDQDQLIVYFLAERAVRYPKARNFNVEGRGWMRRLFRACQDASR